MHKEEENVERQTKFIDWIPFIIIGGIIFFMISYSVVTVLLNHIPGG